MKIIKFITFAFCAFAGVASAQNIVDFGEVTNVSPRYATVEQRRQVCDDISYQSNPQPERNAGNYLLGGIGGAIVGNQIGGGNGKTIATVAGALLGANAADNRDARYSQPSRCRMESNFVEEQRGFNVTYVYMGRQFTTVTYAHPGNRIRLSINITPVTSSW